MKISGLKNKIEQLPLVNWALVRPMLKTNRVSEGIKSSTDVQVRLVVLSRSVLSNTFLLKYRSDLEAILNSGAAKLISDPMINNKKLGILMGVSYNVSMINLRQ
jgi:hypothetical protein